jgi:serine/threonine-protein kinase
VQTSSEQTRERPPAQQDAAREKTCWQCGHTLITSELFCPHDGARLIDIALREDHDPLVGQLIDGRYLVQGRIGEGGMGMVYRATPREGGDAVAIKVLKADYLRDEQIRRRFMHEARIVSNLQHPQAVRLHDFGQMPDGNFFMVMELLQGESLAERLTYKFLSWREVFDIVTPICRALGEAHSKGVVHRDLKPENIFIARGALGEETPKLIDFGVARQLDQATITHTGAMWGTPAYMSPEQARGERVEAAADIYAIGIILYELICGTLPFNASSQMGYAVKHMHEQPRSLTTLPGLVSPPPELDALILELLEKDPARRPASIEHVAQRLDAIRARWFDEALLDLTPALEIDPVGLQQWLNESVVDASTSLERPAYIGTAPPPTGAHNLSVSQTYEELALSSLAPTAPGMTPPAAAARDNPQQAAPRSPAAPMRSAPVAGLISIVAILLGGAATFAILAPADAPSDANALTREAVPQAPRQEQTTLSAQPPVPPPSDLAPIAQPRALPADSAEDAIARAASLAAETAMHARMMTQPAPSAQIRTVIRKIRVRDKSLAPETPKQDAGTSVRDAIKKTL